MKNAGPAFTKTLNGIAVTVWANFPKTSEKHGFAHRLGAA